MAGENQRIINVIRQAIEQDTGQSIYMTPGTVDTASAYVCTVYIQTDDLVEDVWTPAGLDLNAGDYVIVGQIGSTAWVDRLIPTTLYSLMMLNYNKGQIYFNTDNGDTSSWDNGSLGDMLYSGGSGSAYWGPAPLVPHTHDHGDLTGNTDDDHTQYARADGTRAITGTQTFNEDIVPDTNATGSLGTSAAAFGSAYAAEVMPDGAGTPNTGSSVGSAQFIWHNGYFENLKSSGSINLYPEGSANYEVLFNNDEMLPRVAGGFDLGSSSAYFGSVYAEYGVFTSPYVNTYTSGGTWTKPAGISYIVVEVQAGGGGGGGCSNPGTGAACGGSGGSGGGYAKKLFTASDLSSASSLTVTVGSAGTAGSAGSAGGNGGNSSISGTGITTITANGGTGGRGDSSGSTGSSATEGYAGGIATGGDVNIRGGSSSEWRGYEGVSIFTSGGGDSYFGVGGRERFNESGLAGQGYGAGGSGGNSTGNTSSRTGGAGVAGVVYITEYYA